MTQQNMPGTGGTPTPPGKKNSNLVWILVGVAVLLMVCCCGGLTTCYWFARSGAKSVAMRMEKMEEQAKADARRQGMSMGGVTEGAVAKLPDNFPSDVPIFSGMSPTMSYSDKAREAGMAMFTASGKVGADVIQYYQKELPGQGWKEDNVVNIGATTTLIYSKEGRTVTVMATANDDNTTMVQITYGKK